MIFKVKKIESKNNGLMLTLVREGKTQEFLVKKNTKFYQDWGEILTQDNILTNNVIVYATVNYSNNKIQKIDAINTNTLITLQVQTNEFCSRINLWLEDLHCCGYSLEKIEKLKQALIDFA